jgi:CubicO group peptidase (beta-lactamase class C family)
MSAMLLAGQACAATGPAGSTMNKLDTFAASEMQQQKIPGMAVVIVQRGEVVAAKGYGYANVELGVPVTSETIFQAGSLGKQFTAVAVMLQVEEGKLALDDSITKYFPTAPATWRPITVRQLLTHTSGIPDFVTEAEHPKPGVQAIDYRRDYTEAQLEEMAFSLPLAFEPGSRWSYSNTGYVLLGILVHKVSGKFYGDVLQERVFTPLGMKTTRIISEADIVPNRAAGYRLVNGEIRNQEWVAPSLNTTADGSLYLSALDLIAWEKALRAGALLKPASWAQVYSPVTLNSGKSYPYGFGWAIGESAGRPWYYHGGTWQGFRTYISRHLAEDLTVVLLTNLGDTKRERIIDGMTALIDPSLAMTEPSRPIADTNPELARRVLGLLEKARTDTLKPADLSYLGEGFPEQSGRLHAIVKPLGTPVGLDLVDRRELGDESVSTYVARFGTASQRIRLGLAANNAIVFFEVGTD